MVLLQLPIRDMLGVMQVSQSWKSIITNSPRIQVALYLLPAASTKIRNPSVLTFDSRGKHVRNATAAEVYKQCNQVSATGEPLLNYFAWTVFPNETRVGLSYWPESELFKELTVSQSWRKMYVCQPSVTRVRAIGDLMRMMIIEPSDAVATCREFLGESW